MLDWLFTFPTGFDNNVLSPEHSPKDHLCSREFRGPWSLSLGGVFLNPRGSMWRASSCGPHLIVYTNVVWGRGRPQGRPTTSSGVGELEIKELAMSLSMVTLGYWEGHASLRTRKQPLGHVPTSPCVLSFSWFWFVSFNHKTIIISTALSGVLWVFLDFLS